MGVAKQSGPGHNVRGKRHERNRGERDLAGTAEGNANLDEPDVVTDGLNANMQEPDVVPGGVNAIVEEGPLGPRNRANMNRTGP